MASFRKIFSSEASASSAYIHHLQHVSKLIHFLESPEWITRTDEYLEQESIMFDPAVPHSDLYKQIYDNYRILIDRMLAEFRIKSKFSAELLAQAITDTKKQSLSNRIVKELIQPLLIYEDYNKFKEIMINQNIELQTQAMESIQKQTGSFPFTTVPEAGQALEPSRVDDDRTYDALMDLVLKRSKEEYEQLQRRIREEETAIDKALHESEQIAQLLASQSHVSVHDLRELVQHMEALTTVAEEEEHAGMPITQSGGARPLAPTVLVTVTKALEDENPNDMISVKQFISPEELKRRQDYLRAQRDKLLSRKEALRAQEEAATRNGGGSGNAVKVSESRKRLAQKLQTQMSSSH